MMNTYQPTWLSQQNGTPQPNFNPVLPYPMQQNQAIQQPVRDERLWVQGVEGAKVYLMAPNSFVRLWDSTQNVFYEKSADASGKPTLKAFEYSEISNEGTDKNIEKELTELKRRIEQLEGLNNERKTTYESISKSITDDFPVSPIHESDERAESGRYFKQPLAERAD